MKKLTVEEAQDILGEVLLQMENIKNVTLYNIDDFTEYLLVMSEENAIYREYSNKALTQSYSSNNIIFRNLFNAISAYLEYQYLYVNTKKDRLNQIYFQE